MVTGFRKGGRARSFKLSKGFGEVHTGFAGQEVRDLHLSHGMGDYELDLSQAVFPAGTASVHVALGMGDLTVVVPERLPVHVCARAGMGEVNVLEQLREGFAPRVEFETSGYQQAERRCELDISAGMGKVFVRRG